MGKKIIIIGTFFLGIAFAVLVYLAYVKSAPLIKKVKAKLQNIAIENIPKAKQALVLSDFENTNDLNKWEFINTKAELSDEHVTSGNKSLKVYFHPSQETAGLKMEDYLAKNKELRDWAKYEAFSLNIFNPYDKEERFLLKIKDGKGNSVKEELILSPRNNRIDIDISRLWQKMKPDGITQCNLFLWKNNAEKIFYIDNVRLLPANALSMQAKSILRKEFLPGSGEKIYAKGDYFAFDKTKSEIPLTIKNRLAIELKEVPFSGGVPFPKGRLNSLANLALVDSSRENSILFQAKALSYWPDKSIKWALVTFVSGLAPNETKKIYLLYSDTLKKQDPDSSMVVEDESGNVIVNTGVLKLNINNKNFYLFDKAWLDKNSDGKFDNDEIMATGTDLVLVHRGIEYYSHLDKSYKLSVEEKGPVRACIKAQGWFISENGDKFCQFVVRIYAFKGLSSLKVQHTFIYTGYPQNQFHYLYRGKNLPKNETIDAVFIKTPLRIGEGVKFTFAADNKVVQGNFSATTLFMQKDSTAYEIIKNAEMINSGGQLRGWLDLSNNEKGVALGIKNFWQQFPKAFVIDKVNNCLLVYLWPKEAGELDFKTTQAAHGPGEVARGSAFGIAKTHDIFFYFHKSDYELSNTKNIIEGLNSELAITVDAQWILETRALGGFWPYDHKLGGEEEFLSRLFNWGDRQIEKFKWYGMIDFGDTLSWYRKEAYDKSYDQWGWHPEGRWGWFNCEGVGTHTGALLQFLRTGDYKYFTFGVNLSRHIMDIDTCHYNTVANDNRLKRVIPDDYSQVGSMHRHNGNHWGGRNEETSHTNITGLLLYYYLTGDERAHDVLEEVGKFFLSERMTYFGHPDISPQRSIANVLWGDVLLFELTQDEHYKKAADRLADLFYQGQKESGSWSENYNPKKKRWEGQPNSMFMTNYTIPALIEYHKLTGNKAIAECLIKAVDFISRENGHAPYAEALAYAYWLSGNKKYVEDLKKLYAFLVKRQKIGADQILDGMIYQKAYYARVMEYLYSVPHGLEVLANE